MSTISFTTDTLGLAIANAGVTKTELNHLTEQASSGYIADSYGGLTRTQASTSLSLQPVLTGQKALKDGIDAAQGGMNVTQTTLQAISQVASSFYSKIANLNGLSASEVDSTAANARDALRQVAGLLDAQYNGTYVFAGSDGSNPPVPNPDQIGSSAFVTAIGTAVAGLSDPSSANSIIQTTLNIAGTGADSITPFSSAITNGTAKPPIVVTGPGQTEQVGVLAGSNLAIQSLGSSTTGSYTRDILRALATIGSLSSSQLSASGFQALTHDTYTSLGGAITALNQDAGVLGDRQAALTQQQTTLSDISTALTNQLSGAQTVDMASTLSQLTAAQTRLQSSYQLISGLQSLSLTKYLVPGA